MTEQYIIFIVAPDVLLLVLLVLASPLFVRQVFFVIAALEGTKEVKASNSDSGKILNIWRDENGAGMGEFPEEKSRNY